MNEDIMRRTSRLVLALARSGYTPLAEIGRQADELERALDAAEPVAIKPLKPEDPAVVVRRARAAGL